MEDVGSIYRQSRPKARKERGRKKVKKSIRVEATGGPRWEQFCGACQRIELLWQELRIPDVDRDYFSRMQFQPRSEIEFASCEEQVALQLRILLEHRKATITVLKRITQREQARSDLKNCLVLFSEDGGKAEAAKTCLKVACEATVDVVAAITEWRTHLTEPRPLLWRSTNYLFKMSNDMKFLEEDAAVQVMHHLLMQRILAQHELAQLLQPLLILRSRATEEYDGVDKWLHNNGLSIETDTPAAGEIEEARQHSEQTLRIQNTLECIEREPSLHDELYQQQIERSCGGVYVPLLNWHWAPPGSGSS
jgi:hypothetical protein